MWEISNKTVSCREVKHRLQLPVTLEAIRKVIRADVNIKYLKKKKPYLTKVSLKKRLDWAMHKAGWRKK